MTKIVPEDTTAAGRLSPVAKEFHDLLVVVSDLRSRHGGSIVAVTVGGNYPIPQVTVRLSRDLILPLLENRLEAAKKAMVGLCYEALEEAGVQHVGGKQSGGPLSGGKGDGGSVHARDGEGPRPDKRLPG